MARNRAPLSSLRPEPCQEPRCSRLQRFIGVSIFIRPSASRICAGLMAVIEEGIQLGRQHHLAGSARRVTLVVRANSLRKECRIGPANPHKNIEIRLS